MRHFQSTLVAVVSLWKKQTMGEGTKDSHCSHPGLGAVRAAWHVTLTAEDIPGKPGKKTYWRQPRQREAEENSKMFSFEKVKRMMTILTALQRDPTSRDKNLKD